MDEDGLNCTRMTPAFIKFNDKPDTVEMSKFFFLLGVIAIGAYLVESTVVP